MIPQPIQLLDTVTLLEDLPQRNLQRGEVGTVVEILAPALVALKRLSTVI